MESFFAQEYWTFISRIFIAAVLGGILGLERDIHGRGAGLRTHLLVSAGAALFMVLSIYISRLAVGIPADFNKVTDPGRIAAQIVTGIGFLGAGVIIKEGFTVRGLTTAACLWIAAAIGMSAGAGLYTIATVTTILALFSLVILRRLEHFYRRDVYRNLVLTVPNEVEIRQVIEKVKSKEVMIIFCGQERDYETQMNTVILSLRIFLRGNADKLSHQIINKIEQSNIPLKSIKWTRT